MSSEYCSSRDERNCRHARARFLDARLPERAGSVEKGRSGSAARMVLWICAARRLISPDRAEVQVRSRPPLEVSSFLRGMIP